MIEKKGIHADYLFRYKDGKIKQGLGIGCNFDTYLKFKRKQLNIIVGHDNVGKSYFTSYYFLCLALEHGLRFCIWSGENSSDKILRDMIQMASGKRFKDLTKDEIIKYMTKLEYYFDFVDNSKLYKPKELLSIFDETECDVLLIDPFTGLDRDMEWKENYKFLNECREYVNRTNRTIYICTHPVTESGRSGNYYPDGHMWAGHMKAPTKNDIEGGKAFCNRSCDIISVHRLTKHPDMYLYTIVSVEKIKDVETGGRPSMKDEPLLFDFNNGLGFKFEGVNVLEKNRQKQNEKQTLWS